MSALQINDFATWNHLFTLIFVSQAVAVTILSLVLNNTIYVPVITDFLNYDSVTDTFTNNFNTIGKSNVCLMVSVAAWIAAASHAVQTSNSELCFKELQNKKNSIMKWVEYSMSMAILTASVGFLSGINNVFLQILLWALNIATMREFYTMIYLHNHKKRDHWVPYLCGLLYLFIIWITLFFYFFESVGSASGEIPVFMYVLVPGWMVLFMGIPILVLLEVLEPKHFSNPHYVNKWYMVLSLCTKTYVLWAIAIGIIVSDYRQAV